MAKFTTYQREIVGSNCTAAVINSGNKKKVTVFCPSAEAGKQVAGTIQAAYPSSKVYKSENVFESILTHIALGSFGPVGTAAGIATETWKNFTVNTKSQSAAKKLVTEINSCISDYGAAGVADYSGLGAYDDNSTGGGIGKTTIYLVVGAVLVVVLAIVFTRKRK